VSSFRVTTDSPEETQQLGRRIGALLEEGDLLLLHGTLGAGKTTLTQGIAWGAGVTGYAHSPTFVLVNEYEGRIRVYHLDLYRFEGDETVADLGEVEDLAIDEMLSEGACIVEWGERAAAAFPEEHLAVDIAPGGMPDDRVLTFAPQGARYERILAELKASSD
jgi:tRNA threonylcarbamoyladenosine biosynthesis protein TsaE